MESLVYIEKNKKGRNLIYTYYELFLLHLQEILDTLSLEDLRIEESLEPNMIYQRLEI